MVAQQRKALQSETDSAARDAQIALGTLVALGFITVLAAGAWAIGLVQSMLRPMAAIRASARAIAGGNFAGVLADGFIAGLGTFPHFVFPQFAGALLGRYYFRKRFGKERWRAYAPILLAGYSCGMGLIGMTAVGLVLISKAVSQIAY